MQIKVAITWGVSLCAVKIVTDSESPMRVFDLESGDGDADLQVNVYAVRWSVEVAISSIYLHMGNTRIGYNVPKKWRI